MTGNKLDSNIIVQPRDLHLLSEIATLIDVDREMASVIAPFGSKTQAKQRLLELTRAGFLNRYFAGTIAGGRRAFYRLSAKGAALIGAPVHSPNRKQRDFSQGDLFLEHRMRVNSIFLFAKYRPIPHGLRVVRWCTFRESVSKSIGLIPDGYLEIECSGGTRSMFLEVDLGSETLDIWVRKTQRYLQFALTGEFTKLFAHPQFRVLVITDSERRLETIRSTVARSIDRIFWFTTFELIKREGLWNSIWLRPKGDQRQSLC